MSLIDEIERNPKPDKSKLVFGDKRKTERKIQNWNYIKAKFAGLGKLIFVEYSREY